MSKDLIDSDISFSLIQEGKEKKLHIVEVKGVELWNKIFERNRNYGGYLGFLCGSQGSGKKGLSATIVDRVFREYPDEMVLWGEPTGIPAQFNKIHGDFQVMTHKDFPLELYTIKDGSPLIKSDDFPIRTFRSPKEAITFCKSGILNVLFFHPEKLGKHWMRVLRYFKMDGSWQTVILDESEEIFPLNPKGQQWHDNVNFVNVCKELRKCRINMFFNSQQQWDIDFRMLGKINLMFYLRGARVSKVSPVWQGAVSQLKPGQCYVILDNSDYGIFRFPEYKPKSPEYILLPTGGRGTK